MAKTERTRKIPDISHYHFYSRPTCYAAAFPGSWAAVS